MCILMGILFNFSNVEIKRKGHFSSISPSFGCVTWSINIVQHYHEREILTVLLKFGSLNEQTPSTDEDELIQSEAAGHPSHWVKQFFMQNKKRNRLHVISCTVVIDKLYIHECIFKRMSKLFTFSQKSRKCLKVPVKNMFC